VAGALLFLDQIKGGDANVHLSFRVCDAPNAHACNQVAVELHFIDWNTATVSPVISFEEEMARLRQASG